MGSDLCDIIIRMGDQHTPVHCNVAGCGWKAMLECGALLLSPPLQTNYYLLWAIGTILGRAIKKQKQLIFKYRRKMIKANIDRALNGSTPLRNTF